MSARTMSWGAVIGPVTLVMLPLLAALALGALWAGDRAHAFETPRWDSTRFELVSEAGGARIAPSGAGGAHVAPSGAGRPHVASSAAHSGETWVVAVNPDCEHCMARARELADSARAERCRIVALVVDQPVRPAASVFAQLAMDEVRWDRAAVWRRRWGHRAYGECMRFGGDGRLLATALPGR